MDLFASSIDVFFLLLTLALIPASQWMTESHQPLDHGPPHTPLSSSFLKVRSTQSTPTASPLASPKPSSDLLQVPEIRLVPERPKGHKRKSVSFSLSSMEELHQSSAGGMDPKKRPPTPYVLGPSSPGKINDDDNQPGDGLPHGPMSPLAHSKHVVDPMGVEKKWLLP
ncbi:hypothetical protein BD324DRAFT_401837 [Kockovaella imperatae]|uniref:Uncharacterized protein n=1 Tax=Kockovaella imperatae TaxID=4999 RepID=A0A1Y1UK00_9TREE|nr:hypothetical protein BD324DRAFT_401837 [Kockovaella imperatae]ORX37824.1 hypothetical protein BD324DRAFT_401837 [Kockovaella imperatae]